MQNLLDILNKQLHWVVFLVLEIISLVLLFRFNPYQSSVWFSKATAMAGWVAEQEQHLFNYLDLGAENRRLTRENVTLQYNMQKLREEIAELKHDTTPTELALMEQLEGMEMIPAQVSDNSIKQRDNFILINKGSEDGICPEQGVVCGTGVVGIVQQVGHHYAVVLPVLNSKSNISCRIRGTQYFGSLLWKGGNPLVALLIDVPLHARVKVGDIVETSGFSNVFPAGMFVGKVREIGNSEDGLSFKLKVQLSVDFSNLREVVVINNLERAQINEALDPTSSKQLERMNKSNAPKKASGQQAGAANAPKNNNAEATPKKKAAPANKKPNPTAAKGNSNSTEAGANKTKAATESNHDNTPAAPTNQQE